MYEKSLLLLYKTCFLTACASIYFIIVYIHPNNNAVCDCEFDRFTKVVYMNLTTKSG